MPTEPAKVALSLADWSPISGQHLGDRDFSIALAEQYYEEITHELHHIKSRSIKMYHRIMHEIYNRVL